MGKRTPDLPVTYGEPAKGGRPPRQTWTGRWVTVGDEPFVEIKTKGGPVLYATCGRCDGGISGSIAHYSGIYGGVCFDCGGSGVSKRLGSMAEAQTIVKRRISARARAERKRIEREAAEQAAAQTWREQHPDLAAELAAIRADILAWQDKDEDVPVSGALYDFAFRAGRAPLSEKQTAFAATLVAEFRQEQAEAAARRAAQRYAAEPGEKVTVTGTVAVHHYIEPREYGWSGSYLVVVEGTGEDTGITVKVFSAAESIRALERGQAVRITGTVKAHEVRDGVKQTELARPKAAPVDG